MTSEFNKWWDDDRLTQTNPYPDDSPAFWAWEGWQAGVKAEREACIAAIQAQIDHAHLNELRLTPRFCKRQGEIAVRADDLEAMLDGIRTRGRQ